MLVEISDFTNWVQDLERYIVYNQAEVKFLGCFIAWNSLDHLRK